MSYVFLCLVAILIIIMILFRKNPIVEKYWKYTLILLPAVILIVLSLFKKKGTDTTSDSVGKTIRKIKDDLAETNMIAAVKISAANQAQKDKIQKLEEIKQIDDQAERLKQLAALME